MRNKLLRNTVIAVAIALFLVTVLSIFIFTYTSNEQAKQQAMEVAEYSIPQVEEFTRIQDMDRFIYYKQGSNVRITIYGSQGEALKDTDGIQNLDSYYISSKKAKSLLDESVKVGTEIGEMSMPYKSSKLMYSHYVKVKVVDSVDVNSFLILRFSIPVAAGSLQFLLFVVLLVVFWLIVVVLLGYLFNIMIKASLAPLGTVQSIMTDITNGSYTPADRNKRALDSQADKMVNEIDAIGGMIYDTLSELKDEKDKSNIILKYVKQGVLAINKQGDIILYNNQAKELLGVAEVTKENIYANVDNKAIVNKIRESFKNLNVLTEEVDILNKRIKVESMFADNLEIQSLGNVFMLVILTDVTKEYKDARSRSDFFANASHELKTPLTAISGYSEILTLGFADRDKVEKCAKEINTNAQKMKTLIEDMLQISKMEVITDDFIEEEFSLTNLCSEVISNQEIIAKRKDIKISLIGNEMLIANYKLCLMLVKNLISNAIKYNYNGGSVIIELSHDDNYVILKVKDTGIGISQENLDKIFDRFYKATEGRNDTFEDESSTGLGLYMVKQIIDVHKAKVEVESKLKKGTTFIIKFIKQEIKDVSD